MLRPVFFRNKGAYLVGRVQRGDLVLPLVLPLIHAERGIVVDAVLMTEDEASVVFGFSWSYFRVEAPRPRAMVEFLGSIMPLKRMDELYTAIGFNKHGKTELYRSLMQDLERPDARFAFAEGDEGMVMAVFTLPSFNAVFKIIKDSFGAPKNTTRQAVMDKYHFVFVRDRVGRLADAQEFEHLEFPRRCFPDDLLAYLLSVAGATVRVEGDRVVIRQLYTERRVTPLNLFLRDADDAAACEAVLDYGNAIKDLAAADIFTGDMLLKNFGVTRHGRVICYDYDELCLLSECRFRRLPQPAIDRGGVRRRAVVSRGRDGRVSGGVPRLPGSARAGARGIPGGARRSARRGVLAGRAAAARRRRGVRRVSLPPLGAAQARPRPLIRRRNRSASCSSRSLPLSRASARICSTSRRSVGSPK